MTSRPKFYGLHRCVVYFANADGVYLARTLDITLGQLLDLFGRSLGFASTVWQTCGKTCIKIFQICTAVYSVRGNDVSFSGLLSAAKKAALDKKNARVIHCKKLHLP